MSLIQGCLSRTAATAAELTSARAEHQPAEEIVVTTAADRLTDKLVRLTIAARAATIRWDRTEQSGGTGYDPLLAQAMEELAATLKEIGA